MKKLLIWALPLLVLACQPDSATSNLKTYAGLFRQLEADLKADTTLWGTNLYGPILLVDPASRQVIANSADDQGRLTPAGNVYIGLLPNEMNIANTAIDWHGKRWTMVMLPLPDDPFARRNLLAHELFHRIQPKLQLAPVSNPANAHLDTKEGRILLRLELAALKSACTDSGSYRHIYSALAFRTERYQQFATARDQENQLELNEGLAEYTGLMLSGRNSSQIRRHLGEAIDRFQQNPSFVRSFAYVTLPVYGYFLSTIKSDWNRQVSTATDLTHFLHQAFGNAHTATSLPGVGELSKSYGMQQIATEENARASALEARIRKYKKLFITGPVLTIPLKQMQIQFNPSNLQPLENLGTVYPNLRISDVWGILEADSAALVSSNWNKVTVAVPDNWSGDLVPVRGWRLELKTGWKLVQQQHNHWVLEKE